MTKLTATTVEEQLEEIDYIKKVRELSAKSGDIKIAMLTTITPDNKLRSSPMYTFEIKDDGIIWMFTARDAEKVKDIEQNHSVLLNYSKPEAELYITVNGSASVTIDPDKVNELWKDQFKAWFPHGKADPNLALLKIHPEKAEFWNAPDMMITQVISLIKNTLLGKPYVEGDNKIIDF